MSSGSDCPSYDGISEYGGPCWSCRGVQGRCPLDCPATLSGHPCDLPAGHDGFHKHETPDHNPAMSVGTSVLLWGAGIQPEYPEGAVVLGPWVVQSKDFVG